MVARARRNMADDLDAMVASAKCVDGSELSGVDHLQGAVKPREVTQEQGVDVQEEEKKKDASSTEFKYLKVKLPDELHKRFRVIAAEKRMTAAELIGYFVDSVK